MHVSTKFIFSILLCCTIASCSWIDNTFTSDDNTESQQADPAIAEANAAVEKARKKEAEAKAKAEKAKAEQKSKAAKEKEEAAKLKAEQEAKAAAEKTKTQQQAEAQAIKAEQDAKAKAAQTQAAAIKAEQQAKAEAAAKKAQAEEQASKLKAEQEAQTAAAKKAQAQQQAQAQKAEQEAKAAALKAEQETKAKAAAAQAAALKAEQQVKDEAAAQKAEAQAAKLKAEQEAQAAAAKKAQQQVAAKAEVIAPANVGKANARAKLDSPMYTAVGAIRSGNSSGTIPKWSGSMRGGKGYRSGQPHPDPYGAEKPLFTIHAGNFQQHAANLSEGQLALFKKYPDTFAMPVYKSHRDGRYNEQVEKRTHWNAAKTDLVNGVDGLNDFTGGIPFPFPDNGAEAMWNARVTHPHPTIVGTMDDIAVYLNGNTQRRRQHFTSEFPFAYKSNLIGQTDEKIGINAGLILVTVEEPRRQKGQMTIIHEALDQVKHERKAWVYIPGARRVRRAPTVGFDTPDGPGGLITVDDALGFNGALSRFNWKLIGKKETYIPYHNYKFDSPSVSYSTLLNKGHANPNYMRYELHRTWVVEATLKTDARHVYTKRRFYIDEDSWHFVLSENYDGRGNLWRVGIFNTIYDYSVEGFIARAQMYHDLQSGAYVAMRLTNETSTPDYQATPQGEEYYTPSNLKKMGR